MRPLKKIGLIAPASVVPKVELEQGVTRLSASGFEVKVHPQCFKRDIFFAGKDEERAKAFYGFSKNNQFDVLWCARGGYGASRILSFLEGYTLQNGIPPKKLLVGFSDITVLLEFVRSQWGWVTLHAPMPGLREFSNLSKPEWKTLMQFVGGSWKHQAQSVFKLKWITAPPVGSIEGELVGGNLTVWNSLVGTPYAAKTFGKILFLEDVDESLYRIDRMMNQLRLSGNLKGLKAIVLGSFYRCEDQVPLVLKSSKSNALKPLRPVLAPNFGLQKIFKPLGESLGIPVAIGLKAGHGVRPGVLPLGARYELTSLGSLKLLEWNW